MRTKIILFACTLLILIPLICVYNSMWRVYLIRAFYNTFYPDCPPLPANMLPLLPSGTALTAKTKFANLKIYSIDNQTRIYQWQRKDESFLNVEIVKLKGRSTSATLTYPGDRCEDLPTLFGLKHNLMVFEGEKDCATQEDLYFWLEQYTRDFGAVYTEKGLLVGFRPGNPQIQVVQFKVNGMVPLKIRGANNATITINLDQKTKEASMH